MSENKNQYFYDAENQYNKPIQLPGPGDDALL